MSKKNYVTLILGTIGGVLFAIGMCMCLLPEWDAFIQGIVISAVGIVVLLTMIFVRRKMEGKPAICLDARAVFTVLFGIIGALVLGVGMCMVMVWNMILIGIIVGVLGIILLMGLIPLIKGLN